MTALGPALRTSPAIFVPRVVFSELRQRCSDRWQTETATAAAHLSKPPTASLVCVNLLLPSSPLEWPPSLQSCCIHYDTTASESHSVCEINTIQSCDCRVVI